MTIEDELRTLINKRYGSVNRFAQECGISQSTLFTTLSRQSKHKHCHSNLQRVENIRRRISKREDNTLSVHRASYGIHQP